MARRRRTRLVAKWVFVLLSGAALTASVSWAIGTVIPVDGLEAHGCARKSEPGETRFKPELVYLLQRWESPGIRWLSVGIQRGADPDDWLPDPELKWPAPERVLSAWESRRFAAERRAFELQRNPSGIYAALFEARGWPLPAFWCEHQPVQGGFDIGGRHRAPPMAGTVVGRTLPFRPIWSGVLVDTVFWSGVVASLLFVPGAIRRVRRRRAGLCVTCGYDLTGLVGGAACPECGGAQKVEP